jgi:pyruvate formate lyase activating enzyme
MRIGGLLKFTLIDYPGKVAAVVFTQGCNFRCPFCHNPELVVPELFEAPLPVQDVLEFLNKRKNQLEAVVISGGEPTVHADLADFIRPIKGMGYHVKLDTNGTNPLVLGELFSEKLIDYVAMDIKSGEANYCKASGVVPDITLIRSSVQRVKDSGVAYEFRSTVFKSIVSAADMASIAALLGETKNFHIRRGNLKGKILNYDFFADCPDYTDEEWQNMKDLYSRSKQVIH